MTQRPLFAAKSGYRSHVLGTKSHAFPTPRVRPCRSGHASKRPDGGPRYLERRVEDAEPAGQILLDRQLRLELRLQLQLLGVVALLVLPGRNEGPEGAALVAVDPVDGMLPALELEDRGQELRAEALLLEP